MLKYLKDIFSQDNTTASTPNEEKPGKQVDQNQKLQIATCALFIEVANADDNFTDDERKSIIKVMQDIFDLTKECVEDLIELSEERVKKSVSLYEFTETINQNFNEKDKYQIIKNLWRLIFQDDNLHQYEDYYIRKISSNLMLSHRDFVTAKSEVKEEMGISGD